MKKLAVVVLLLPLVACASIERQQKHASEMAALGLVSHPELADIMAQLRRVDERLDTLLARLSTVEEARQTVLARIATVEEAHRDDTEMVIDYLRRFSDELKAEMHKVRPR